MVKGFWFEEVMTMPKASKDVREVNLAKVVLKTLTSING